MIRFSAVFGKPFCRIRHFALSGAVKFGGRVFFLDFCLDGPVGALFFWGVRPLRILHYSPLPERGPCASLPIIFLFPDLFHGCPLLRELYLKGNRVGPGGIIAISQAIAKNMILTVSPPPPRAMPLLWSAPMLWDYPHSWHGERQGTGQ